MPVSSESNNEVSVSSAEKGPSERWQLKIKSLDEGIRYLYESGTFSDCIISTEKSSYNVHRLILGGKSPVFEDLLMKPDPRPDKLVVSCSPEGFEILIRYIYLNELGTTEASKIIEAYKVAVLYKQKELIEECKQIVEGWEITCLNVFTTLNSVLDMEFLKNRCFQYIKKNSHAAIKSHDFSKVYPKALKEILEEKCFLNVPTAVVVNAVLEWGANQFPKTDTYVHLRDFLMSNHILGKLNMQCLLIEEFLDIMSNYSDLLTPEEFKLLQLHAHKPEKNKTLPEWCE